MGRYLTPGSVVKQREKGMLWGDQHSPCLSEGEEGWGGGCGGCRNQGVLQVGAQSTACAGKGHCCRCVCAGDFQGSQSPGFVQLSWGCSACWFWCLRMRSCACKWLSPVWGRTAEVWLYPAFRWGSQEHALVPVPPSMKFLAGLQPPAALCWPRFCPEWHPMLLRMLLFPCPPFGASLQLFRTSWEGSCSPALTQRRGSPCADRAALPRPGLCCSHQCPWRRWTGEGSC